MEQSKEQEHLMELNENQENTRTRLREFGKVFEMDKTVKEAHFYTRTSL